MVFIFFVLKELQNFKKLENKKRKFHCDCLISHLQKIDILIEKNFSVIFIVTRLCRSII